MLVFFTIILCSLLRTIELSSVIEYGEITPLANGSVDIHVHNAVFSLWVLNFVCLFLVFHFTNFSQL